jgi:hypothetical protein
MVFASDPLMEVMTKNMNADLDLNPGKRYLTSAKGSNRSLSFLYQKGLISSKRFYFAK